MTWEATSTPTIPVATVIGTQPPWSAVTISPATRQMAKVTSPRICELHRGWLTIAMTLGSSEPTRTLVTVICGSIGKGSFQSVAVQRKRSTDSFLLQSDVSDRAVPSRRLPLVTITVHLLNIGCAASEAEPLRTVNPCASVEHVSANSENPQPPGSVGDIIRTARRAKGMTQVELAEKSGLSQRWVSDIERRDTRSPRLSTLRALAATLGLDLVDLVMAAEMAWSRGEAEKLVAEPEAANDPLLDAIMLDVRSLTPEGRRRAREMVNMIREMEANNQDAGPDD